MSTEGCIRLLISFIGVCAQVLTNGVGHQASCDSDRPAEKEGDENIIMKICGQLVGMLLEISVVTYKDYVQ